MAKRLVSIGGDQGSDALRRAALVRISDAGDFDQLLEPLSTTLEALALRSCRLALLLPRSDAFVVHAEINCERGNRLLPNEEPTVFERGDPMTEAIFNRGEPTLWRPHADGRRARSRRAQTLWEEGVGDGASVLARTESDWRVSLCVTAPREEASDAFEARFPALRKPLRLVVAAATYPARRMIDALSPSPLTDIEREILAATATGMRAAEIAESRSVSVPTVRKSLVRTREKLGATTIAQAVAIALRRELILN